MAAHGVVVFDLDGVLVDTHQLHCEAWWRATARVFGICLHPHALDGIRGLSRSESLNHLLGSFTFSATDMARLMSLKGRLYVEFLSDHTKSLLIPGALELIDELRTAGELVALYSASLHARVVLAREGLTNAFDYVSDGYDAGASKPSPERLLRMHITLGASPINSVLLDDSLVGLQAAAAAGMRTLAVGYPQNGFHHIRAVSSITAEELRAYRCGAGLPSSSSNTHSTLNKQSHYALRVPV